MAQPSDPGPQPAGEAGRAAWAPPAHGEARTATVLAFPTGTHRCRGRLTGRRLTGRRLTGRGAVRERLSRTLAELPSLPPDYWHPSAGGQPPDGVA